MTDPCLLRAHKLCRIYPSGDRQVRILDGLNIELPAGQMLAVTGRSGSGKSTLLHLLGGLDRPSEGQVSFRGRNLGDMNARQLAAFRNRHIGFVFQFHHLLANFNTLENVLLPARLGGAEDSTSLQRARELLELVGLGHRLEHNPMQLSGGERQRAAIARALINRPDVLLMDEPTGNLDPQTANQVFDLLRAINSQQRTAMVLVTHSESLAHQADAQLHIDCAAEH